MEYFISLLPWYLKVSTIYYIISAGFYFLMWFFKRPISEFIDNHMMSFKLHCWFWSSSVMPFIHYGIISTGKRSNGEIISLGFYWISTIVYIGVLLYPFVVKLRNSIPDHRK
ncbi:hypothetical protein A4_230 [Escherichia phage A4]|nr:hypothetical protein A4_230 [Escherichia phage A4]